MNTSLLFNPKLNQLTGPAGSLPIPPTDEQARRLVMLIEGQCVQSSVATTAQKFGYCRQRYYQILNAFQEGGLAALQPQKTGPRSNYRRTDQAVRQVLRYRFLDPQASPEVIAQKLRQTQFPISLRSVERIIADYGLQKKTLHPQPQKPAPTAAHSTHRKTPAPRKGRRRKPGTAGPAKPRR